MEEKTGVFFMKWWHLRLVRGAGKKFLEVKEGREPRWYSTRDTEGEMSRKKVWSAG